MTLELRAGLLDLAARQHAAIALRQARALGATAEQCRGLRRSSRWRLVTHRVLVLVGSPPSELQRLMVAVLDAGEGAVASHRSAAALWELPGFDLGALEVSRNRLVRHPEATQATLHLPSLLPASHRAEHLGIPTTSLARTIFDLASQISEKRLGRLVDTVTARSPGTLTRLHEVVDELAASGRGGVRSMRAVLEPRPVGHVPVESGLEARFLEILAEAGEAAPRRQVDVGGHGWIGRVDFADDSPRVLFELDSRLHHTSVTDIDSDRRRDAALRAAGFREIVRISADDVWRRPAEVLQQVRASRSRAQAHADASTFLRRNLGSSPRPAA